MLRGRALDFGKTINTYIDYDKVNFEVYYCKSLSHLHTFT